MYLLFVSLHEAPFSNKDFVYYYQICAPFIHAFLGVFVFILIPVYMIIATIVLRKTIS